MTTNRPQFVPEMIEESRQAALMGALVKLLEGSEIESVWPSAYDAKRYGRAIPHGEVEVVVLPLDRIGAPPGASGASVYIAYYAHSPAAAVERRLASPPFVVKIGLRLKLEAERKGALEWPTLGPEKEKFAFPYHLNTDHSDWAVLVAPFHSRFDIASDGTRNIVAVNDLWHLLENRDELSGNGEQSWQSIRECIGQALDAVQYAHRNSLAELTRKKLSYQDIYKEYLRKTTGSDERCYIPRSIFKGDGTILAFGQEWPNPVLLVEKLIAQGEFTGVMGAIHGDLHPKNIVLNRERVARIIDFGWAKGESHVVLDYLLLDVNVRGTTLPSQLAEGDVLALASFLRPEQPVESLPEVVRARASIIKEEIWRRAKERAVSDWTTEYLIPLLLVGYGLLVHLDGARNQPALVAMVLALTRELEGVAP